jgi:hypothetical protein
MRERKTARGRDEALSLIRRLLGVEVRAASLETLAGGRSNASVFKVKGLPFVVKIAPRAEGLAEKANYEKFVRPGLPAACRAELLGVAEARDRVALCYDFVGGDTLTDRLQQGDAEALSLVLRRAFDPLRKTWYGPDALRRHRDIASYYLERFFAGKRGAARDEARLGACATRYFSARRKDGGYLIGEDWFPSPYEALFAGDRKRPYHSAILHGDLNTDNIVLSRDRRRVTLIDFLRTGRGHAYQDLAFLEESIRINFPPKGSFDEILEIERQIASGKRQGRDTPYATAIRGLRAAASRYFGRVEDRATYPFAIAALGLRLMEATDLTDVARARITISALWAAKALSEER